MKKIIALVLVAVFAVMALVACGGETGTCDACGKEDVKVKGLSYQGEEGKFCDDCYDTMKAALDALEGLGNLGDLGL